MPSNTSFKIKLQDLKERRKKLEPLQKIHYNGYDYRLQTMYHDERQRDLNELQENYNARIIDTLEYDQRRSAICTIDLVDEDQYLCGVYDTYRKYYHIFMQRIIHNGKILYLSDENGLFTYGGINVGYYDETTAKIEYYDPDE